MTLTNPNLAVKESKRNLAGELLQAVREMKEGRAARVTHVEPSAASVARDKSGLSQNEFAKLIGVSLRTLQEWEQGRRKPTGAAQTLLRVAALHPEALRDLQSS
ncbi:MULTISPECIES: helix-turn-helix domain-containing protein [unclassified Caballeronia]|uniref:helix-turn-helix domain-containing protein n=1 Tax=unclassified Caballeronia TaxID=2646786 RepID=UPI002858D3B7|nr:MULTISPECIES: helix-turn-helix domain-containing protein [unclassified Caballeronia]MDR5777283.1 helix-turn-helix domain-containing protein [Caballeronia sp. LZ002]MDR5852721.1 helix-turn-helix domain-containing protein [Caballeronia sp. LZ003]